MRKAIRKRREKKIKKLEKEIDKKRIIVNLEDSDYEVEILKRIKRKSKNNLILLVLSIIFVVIGTGFYMWFMIVEGFNPYYTLFFSLMPVGLILIIISRILIKKVNSGSWIGIIGFVLVVGLFILFALGFAFRNFSMSFP